jgi:membrane fusion protein, multidrug efflux system
MLQRLTFYFLFFSFSIFLFSCSDSPDKKPGGGFGPGGGFNGGPPKDYAVLQLYPRKARLNLDYPSTIQGQQVIEIRPKVDGYIDSIYVNEGATVQKGQLLFRIKNPQYEQEVITATAAIKSAIASVEAAKMEVEKVRPLVEKEIVSKFELESAQYTLDAKEAALAQARATLANANTNLSYTVLRSPLDGVIGTIPYKVGALVNSNNVAPLTTLSNISNVYAYYSMNEKQLLQFFEVTSGSSLQQRVEKLPPANLILADGTRYPEKGKIEMASGLINTETGSVSFKAIFPNPLGIIRSGASAIVRIPTTMDSSLVIPQSATYELQDKRLAYVLADSNKISNVAITTLPTDDGKFFIVTGGLKTGDKVVVEGLISLKDNMTIIPRPVSADSIYAKSNAF